LPGHGPGHASACSCGLRSDRFGPRGVAVPADDPAQAPPARAQAELENGDGPLDTFERPYEAPRQIVTGDTGREAGDPPRHVGRLRA
jgi:hypothetical protein